MTTLKLRKGKLHLLSQKWNKTVSLLLCSLRGTPIRGEPRKRKRGGAERDGGWEEGKFGAQSAPIF